MIKLNLKKKLLISVLSLFSISSCFNANSSISSTTLTASSTSVSSSINLVASDQVKLVAVEVDKLPTRINYLSTEVISTSGGVLRVVYSDYQVRYVSMNDAMIEVSRLNTSSVGTSRVTLRYEELGTTLFTSYQINIIPFKVALQKVELDIISSDVAFEQKVDLNYVIYPLNAYYQQVEWSSSNELIARVDSNGVVTPINQGEVLISVKIDNNFTATSKLNILPMQPREIQLNPTFVGLIEQGWIPLSSANDLATIDNNLSSSSYVFAANTSYALTVENKTSAQMLDLNYFLVNNIDLSSIANWTPLETFTGELDGKGYSIQNLTLSSSLNSSTQGMFTIINNASIQNLTILDAKVTINLNNNTTYSNFGILSGIIQGTSTINNLKILSTSSGTSFLKVNFQAGATTSRPSKFGAIAGFLRDNVSISNTIIDTDVNAYDSTGGFIGDITNLSTLNINDSKFIGRIIGGTMVSLYATNIGGLIGSIFSQGTINITRSGVKSNLHMFENNKETYQIGGIIGLLREERGTPNITPGGPAPVLNMNESFFIGNITGYSNIGKFIGGIYNNSIGSNKLTGSVLIRNSYAIGNLTSPQHTSGQLIGSAHLDSRTVTLEQIYAIGNVTRATTNKTRLGILIGTNGNNGSTGTNDSSNTGIITLTNVFYSNFSTYEKIDTDVNPRIIGTESNSSTLTGVTALSEANLKNSISYSAWTNFNTIWRINPNINNGYPYLAWEE
jgi:hypothetical protein